MEVKNNYIFGGVQMDSYWSTYVQESKELYSSRALRFHDGNKELWLKALQIKDGMKVLEVGCGGGVFCHKIKEYLPKTDITGLDFDTGHIEYAKVKSAELNLNCNFVNCDATDLPFEDDIFDICFSHTVINFCEPKPFIKEQYRVLKPNGKIIILCIINSPNKPEWWIPTDDCDEKVLFDKLWAEARKNELSDIKKYENNELRYFEYLQEQGFKDISADVFAVLSYSPSFADVSDKMAIDQINEGRLSELCSAQKAFRLAPNCLSTDEFNSMLEMINKRYDNMIDKYKSGDKSWDYRASTILAISGMK